MGMRDMALGHFRDFKGGDSILLACSNSGIERLLTVLMSPPAAPVAIHAMATVAPNHPAQLFASTAPLAAVGFTWLTGRDQLHGIRESLAALAASAKGHPYFYPVDSDSQLLVSHHEHDPAWLHPHA
jgi:hypothetical protein